MMDNHKKWFIIAIILILIGFTYRFLPHPPNFSPLMAITIFSSFVLSKKINKYFSFSIPLIILFISDLIIGFSIINLFVYIGFLISSLLSYIYSLKVQKNIIIHSNLSGLINNTVFFIISNFGVWIFTNMYSKTWQGLIECYYNAIPFFKNSVLSTLIFTTIIFLIYPLLEMEKREQYDSR